MISRSWEPLARLSRTLGKVAEAYDRASKVFAAVTGVGKALGVIVRLLGG